MAFGDESLTDDTDRAAAVTGAGAPSKGSRMSSLLTKGNVLFLVILLAIFLVTIYLRTPLLRFQGFYEPDGFFHYAVIRAAVNNGFSVPHYLSISGWPQHSLVSEPDGLYWVTLIPYAFIQYLGISYYTVMRVIPILFALLDAVGAYFLARFISRDRVFGLLVMAFVGLSAGDAARTSALIYRGDGFVTIFLILALIFMAKLLSEKRHVRKLLYMFLAGLALSAGSLVWNGASFAIAVFVLAFVLLTVYAFVTDKEHIYRNMLYALCSLLVWFVLAWLYVFAGFMLPQTFNSPYFLMLWAGLLAGWLVMGFLLRNKNNYQIVSTPYGRLAITVLLIGVGGATFYLVAYGFLYTIFVANGFVVTSGFAATIQELTPPTFSFLFASFNIALFMSPMSMMMVLSSLVSGAMVIFWIMLVISFIPYLLMRVYDSGGWLNGSARITRDIKPEVFILVAYMALTSYLQMTAIRFNSLVSIPLAIFSAYTLYWVILAVKKGIERSRSIEWAFWGLATFLWLAATAALYVVLAAHVSLAWQANAVIAMILALPVSLVATYMVHMENLALAEGKKPGRLLPSAAVALSLAVVTASFTTAAVGALVILEFALAVIAAYLFVYKENATLFGAALLIAVLVLMAVVLYYDIQFSSFSQADFINPLFLNATSWIKANTPANSVFLTLWPDGSVIEGWGNRTSVTDSVGAQNGATADPFAAWLLNSSEDPGFLESNVSSRPNYLLVRNIWLEESQGIFEESLLNSSMASYYGYAPLTSIYESRNGSALDFRFTGPGVDAYMYTQNGLLTNSFITFNSSGGQAISPITYVALYNQNNGNFSIQTNTAYNRTNGELLLVIYSTVPSAQLPFNVTSVAVFAPGMSASNMLKLVYFCNNNVCLWNKNNMVARLTQVYPNAQTGFNPDTKIFKITYLNVTQGSAAASGAAPGTAVANSIASNSVNAAGAASANSIAASANSIAANAVAAAQGSSNAPRT